MPPELDDLTPAEAEAYCKARILIELGAARGALRNAIEVLEGPDLKVAYEAHDLICDILARREG